MKGFVVEVAERNDLTGEQKGAFEPAVFSPDHAGAVDWLRANVTNPDLLVRILPAVAMEKSKVDRAFEIGRAH